MFAGGFSSRASFGNKRLVCQVHRLGFLAHAAHPTVDKVLVLFLYLVPLLLGDVELQVEGNKLVLDVLYFFLKKKWLVGRSCFQASPLPPSSRPSLAYLDQFGLSAQLFVTVAHLDCKRVAFGCQVSNGPGITACLGAQGLELLFGRLEPRLKLALRPQRLGQVDAELGVCLFALGNLLALCSCDCCRRSGGRPEEGVLSP